MFAHYIATVTYLLDDFHFKN